MISRRRRRKARRAKNSGMEESENSLSLSQCLEHLLFQD